MYRAELEQRKTYLLGGAVYTMRWIECDKTRETVILSGNFSGQTRHCTLYGGYVF